MARESARLCTTEAIMRDWAQVNDGELVAATIGGDHEAYKELVGRYQGHVYGLAFSVVSNWADAQDIAQEKLKALLPAELAKEMATVQEVFNEHKLPAEFSRDVWRLCMDWLCTGESGIPSDPKKQQNIALAAARDPDVAAVNEWRKQAEPIPEWALRTDVNTPHWGVEITTVRLKVE
jgi:hypothetical protein